MIELLKKYPVIIEIPVAWGEMDSLKHVNNVAYFRYFESVRIAYFRELRVLEYLDQTDIGPILASTKCNYRAPVTYPDTLSAGARTIQITGDRLFMEYSIVSHRIGKVAAQGEGEVVFYDYRHNCKVPLPDEILKRIMELDKIKN